MPPRKRRGAEVRSGSATGTPAEQPPALGRDGSTPSLQGLLRYASGNSPLLLLRRSIFFAAQKVYL
jgi:hypothetical protein